MKKSPLSFNPIIVFVLLFIAVWCQVTAQTPTFEWARQIGRNNIAGGNYVTTDHRGNVYVCGSFLDTVDMDPGPGTYTLSAAPGKNNTFVLKLDSNGAFL